MGNRLPPFLSLVERDFHLHIAPVRWAKQAMMGKDHRMQRSIDFPFPEVDEIVECRKFRRQIILLPDEQLQQMRMIRQMIIDLGGGQPIAGQLQFKFRLLYACRPR